MTTRTEGAILIHGLGLSVQGASMRPLALRLRRAGYAVTCLDYPSSRMSLDDAVRHLAPYVRSAGERWDRVHLVGHSLGGLLAVRLHEALPEEKQGRVVQIGSPNLGSPLATVALRLTPIRAALGPALGELQHARPRHALWDKRPGVGAIAGRTGWGPAARLPASWREGLEGETDGKVTVASALAGADGRAVIPVGHAFLPASRRVADAVIAYLRDGAFPAAIRVEREVALA
ncbi:esterase/lipase family protein [Parvularcula dongshanensis]|uniref:Pimeloyl-ACP methyl ester carboxylesterase n=1 Tax=Parvularcula dongshanensis TaxID=1173995 RepID=A0A840I0Q2_9PROT|nr:alpha/beta hydrolase [Parvularcula dongshanensis]MBB4657782.1 pimeloyl-ACP methyl ester carboxylesterase [Parvularcula dongshanensis]